MAIKDNPAWAIWESTRISTQNAYLAAVAKWKAATDAGNTSLAGTININEVLPAFAAQQSAKQGQPAKTIGAAPPAPPPPPPAATTVSGTATTVPAAATTVPGTATTVPGTAVKLSGNGNAFVDYTDTDTQGDDMATWADLIRSEQSMTRGGRLESYLQNLDVGPLGYMNPAVRSIARNWYDPMSSRYLLAAAPTSMGGYAPWRTTDVEGVPAQSSFMDYLGGPLTFERGIPAFTPEGEAGAQLPYEYGAYKGKGVGTGAGFLQAFQPWTRQQWAGRLGQLGLWDDPTAEQKAAGVRGTVTSLADLTDEQRDYLGMFEMPEVLQMIRGATMSGMNPIARRAYQPGLSRAMSAWRMANPELGAGELLRQFAIGSFTDPQRTTPYMPGVNVPATTGPTTFL